MLFRNVFKTDYRSEEIGYLKASGKTDAEIERYVPKTTRERVAVQKSARSEYETLKLDVFLLKSQVSDLTSKLSRLEMAYAKLDPAAVIVEEDYHGEALVGTLSEKKMGLTTTTVEENVEKVAKDGNMKDERKLDKKDAKKLQGEVEGNSRDGDT
eukprot:CAMPEP_0172511258 /NCGR_PEP_ID=MMETSP1066-20121228/235061_1 /TAXON_ID=671091 /ORGANISM="Coscinodiscus wailesii, Strain CCMP2513" /LENGTH=154 /DNA_ID=CAMNT_0013290565 /DNA_START=367 /DNA_END=831 /DNA_ORIENTATION=+